MRNRYVILVLFLGLFFVSDKAFAAESDVFIRDLNESLSEKILDSLMSEDERFSSYSDLIEKNKGFKYYVYSSQNSNDINLLFYSGSYGGLGAYSNRVEVNLLANEFEIPNLFTFDSEGNFKSKTNVTGYVSIYNENGYYMSGIRAWSYFENYKGGSESGDGFVWPKVILDVFDKLNNIFSDFGQFIKDIFVPSDTNIIQNSLKDMSSKISEHFKPILDSLESIKELFTPDQSVISANMLSSSRSDQEVVTNDFYEIEINIPELGVDHVQPFKPYSQSRLIIYLICNSLLVITTLVHLIRRIMGSGDVIE